MNHTQTPPAATVKSLLLTDLVPGDGRRRVTGHGTSQTDLVPGDGGRRVAGHGTSHTDLVPGDGRRRLTGHGTSQTDLVPGDGGRRVAGHGTSQTDRVALAAPHRLRLLRGAFYCRRDCGRTLKYRTWLQWWTFLHTGWAASTPNTGCVSLHLETYLRFG